MTFREFLDGLYYCFSSTVGYIENVIATILNTHFGKLAIYFLIFSIIVFLLFELYKLLLNIANNQVNEMQDIIIREKNEKENDYQPKHAIPPYQPKHVPYQPRHEKKGISLPNLNKDYKPRHGK